MKLRSFALLLSLLLGCLVFAAPANAKLIDIKAHVGHDQLQAACGAAGGQFSESPDGNGYGCGTNCKGGPGTNCYVACDNGGKCVGQTPGRLVADVTLVDFLRGTFIRDAVVLPDDTGTPNHDHSGPAAPKGDPSAGDGGGVPVLQ